MLKLCLISSLIFGIVFQSNYALAQNNKADLKVQNVKSSSIFVALPQTIIINYVDENLHQLRTDIGVRVRNVQTAEAIQRHLPSIQNFLLDFLAKQNRETFGDEKKLQALRELAVKKITKILHKESEPAEIEALFFMTFRME
ncbi:MAG: flagellar basal body-associated FliL family protein [Pseudomonadota bacterium]